MFCLAIFKQLSGSGFVICPAYVTLLPEACQYQQPSLREIVRVQYSNKQHHIKTSNSVLRIGSKLAAACMAFSKSFMTDLQVLYKEGV